MRSIRRLRSIALLVALASSCGEGDSIERTSTISVVDQSVEVADGERTISFRIEEVVEGGREWYLFSPGAAYPSYQIRPSVERNGPTDILKIDSGSSIAEVTVAVRWDGPVMMNLPIDEELDGWFLCADYLGRRCFQIGP